MHVYNPDKWLLSFCQSVFFYLTGFEHKMTFIDVRSSSPSVKLFRLIVVFSTKKTFEAALNSFDDKSMILRKEEEEKKSWLHFYFFLRHSWGPWMATGRRHSSLQQRSDKVENLSREFIWPHLKPPVNSSHAIEESNRRSHSSLPDSFSAFEHGRHIVRKLGQEKGSQIWLPFFSLPPKIDFERLQCSTFFLQLRKKEKFSLGFEEKGSSPFCLSDRTWTLLDLPLVDCSPTAERNGRAEQRVRERK